MRGKEVTYKRRKTIFVDKKMDKNSISNVIYDIMVREESEGGYHEKESSCA